MKEANMSTIMWIRTSWYGKFLDLHYFESILLICIEFEKVWINKFLAYISQWICIIFHHIMYIIGGKSSTQMVRFSLPNVGQFRSRLGNFLKPLKCSAGHAEFSFNNTAKDFFAKSRKKFIQSPKIIIYYFWLFLKSIFKKVRGRKISWW